MAFKIKQRIKNIVLILNILEKNGIKLNQFHFIENGLFI